MNDITLLGKSLANAGASYSKQDNDWKPFFQELFAKNEVLVVGEQHIHSDEQNMTDFDNGKSFFQVAKDKSPNTNMTYFFELESNIVLRDVDKQSFSDIHFDNSKKYDHNNLIISANGEVNNVNNYIESIILKSSKGELNPEDKKNLEKVTSNLENTDIDFFHLCLLRNESGRLFSADEIKAKNDLFEGEIDKIIKVRAATMPEVGEMVHSALSAGWKVMPVDYSPDPEKMKDIKAKYQEWRTSIANDYISDNIVKYQEFEKSLGYSDSKGLMWIGSDHTGREEKPLMPNGKIASTLGLECYLEKKGIKSNSIDFHANINADDDNPLKPVAPSVTSCGFMIDIFERSLIDH